MNAYPIELRRRVLDAVDNKLGTQQKIAHTFSVSAIWIRKLLQRRRETVRYCSAFLLLPTVSNP
jgi:transposase